MANVKLLKSLRLTHGIVKFMKVMTIIGVVMVALLSISVTLSDELIVYAIRNSNASEIQMLFGSADIAPEYVVSIIQAGAITALVSSVIAYLYLKKGEDLLRRMTTESVFANFYGDELREIGKLMIIQVVAGYFVEIVAIMMIAPQAGISGVSLDFSGLFTAAFVYLASYLMDHAYENMINSGSHVIYPESISVDETGL